MNLKRSLGKILIFCGVVIILFAVITKAYTNYKQKSLLEDYKSIIFFENESDEGRYEESSETYDAKNSDGVNLPEGENVIGILEIPKIDLETVIGEGTDNEILKYMVGHFTKTAKPGEKGNFCVVGHRNYVFGQFFNRLDEVTEGDEIIVKTASDTFVYTVNSVSVVEPEDISVLEPTSQETVTLVTCTPIHSATHRLIVKGILQK